MQRLQSSSGNWQRCVAEPGGRRRALYRDGRAVGAPLFRSFPRWGASATMALRTLSEEGVRLCPPLPEFSGEGGEPLPPSSGKSGRLLRGLTPVGGNSGVLVERTLKRPGRTRGSAPTAEGARESSRYEMGSSRIDRSLASPLFSTLGGQSARTLGSVGCSRVFRLTGSGSVPVRRSFPNGAADPGMLFLPQQSGAARLAVVFPEFPEARNRTCNAILSIDKVAKQVLHRYLRN